MTFFAQIDANEKVLRVVVCDSQAWLESTFGGTWVETVMDDPVLVYAGIDYYFSMIPPGRFVTLWRQPTGASDAYEEGAWVWWNNIVWESLTPNNVWEPGAAAWRDALNPWPEWIQPVGSVDAYRLNAQVTHNSFHWINTGSDANVWEPGVFGWTQQ